MIRLSSRIVQETLAFALSLRYTETYFREVMAVKPLLLCIHMEKERALRLSFLAMSLGVRVKLVSEAQQGQRLAALCGLEEEAPAPPAAAVGQEMLVLAFFEDAQIDRLLAALRGSGLGPVALKAVLTEHNRAWDCGRLYRELSMEAAAFAARGEESK